MSQTEKTQCINHPTVPAAVRCKQCAQPACTKCIVLAPLGRFGCIRPPAPGPSVAGLLVVAASVVTEFILMRDGPVHHVLQGRAGHIGGFADEFIPELPALALEIDPLHQHKDVLAHTIAVVEKASARLELRLAALFHDIGKPKTRG